MAFVLREFSVQPRCEGREFLDTLGCRVAVVCADTVDMTKRRLDRVQAWLAGDGRTATPKARARVEYHERELVALLEGWT